MRDHQPLRLEPDVKAFSRDAVKRCREAWREFLRRTGDESANDRRTDISLWVPSFGSGTVKLTPRSSAQDESDPAWEPPPLIGFLVDGIGDRMAELRRQRQSGASRTRKEEREIERRYREWIHSAILESFQSASIQRQFQKRYADRPFSIFWTENDEGLHCSQLHLLWKNEQGLTARRVRNKQERLQEETPPRKVKKKSSSQIQREGRGSKRKSVKK